jgi:predicted secreted hydrolase
MRLAVLGMIGCCVLASVSRAVAPPVDFNVPGDERFEQAREPRAFQFPHDHGPHDTFRHEWWYVTGHLESKQGERFGFELTFFRYALAPPASTSEPQEISAGTSRWRTRQIYMAHFAITDISRRQFRFAQSYARGALGLAGAQATPFRVWLEDWSLGESKPSEWQLRAAEEKYTLTLELQPLLSPVLNGEQGLSRKSRTSGAASYYYSIPRIAVRGEIVRDGKPITVEGLAWLDREWSSSPLAATIAAGWNWFALQLDDGSTLMFYEFRDRKGVRDPNSAGTWVAPDGAARHLTSEDVQLEIQDYWTSPRGGRYPARWRVHVPSLNLDIDVKPALADQELNTSPRYWEGAVDVTGTRADRSVRGNGYVELVGYARNPQEPVSSTKP